jgi:hypothetical protein
MATGKSREERIAAHENLDSSKFKKVYGDEPSEKGAVPPWMRKDSNISEQELKDHIDIWEKHTDLPLESKSFEKFLYSKPNIKNSLIRSAAKLSQDVSQDVDDALYKSDSWQRITKPKDKDSFGFGTTK